MRINTLEFEISDEAIREWAEKWVNSEGVQRLIEHIEREMKNES